MNLANDALDEFPGASPALVMRIVSAVEREAAACGAAVTDRRAMRRNERRLRRAALDAAGYGWWPLVLNVISFFVPTPVRIALWVVRYLTDPAGGGLTA